MGRSDVRRISESAGDFAALSGQYRKRAVELGDAGPEGFANGTALWRQRRWLCNAGRECSEGRRYSESHDRRGTATRDSRCGVQTGTTRHAVSDDVFELTSFYTGGRSTTDGTVPVYCCRRFPEVAARYTDAIVTYCENLRTFPLRGHRA